VDQANGTTMGLKRTPQWWALAHASMATTAGFRRFTASRNFALLSFREMISPSPVMP
jgi:hypothetical protein